MGWGTILQAVHEACDNTKLSYSLGSTQIALHAAHEQECTWGEAPYYRQH
jgi:hypothetical protein